MHEEYVKTRQAAQAVAARLGLYIHGGIFALVVLILALINFANAPDDLWVQWVFLGWGLGVVLHAVLVLGTWPRRVRTWQLRKIRRLRESL